MQKSLRIGEILRLSWKAFKENAFMLIFLTLSSFIVQIFFGIPGCDTSYGYFGEGEFYRGGVCSLITALYYILGIFITMGYATMGLVAAKGEKVTWTTFFIKFGKFFHFFIAMILYAIIVAVGFVLLIFPGVIWALRYSMYPFMALDKGAFGWTALKLSSQATYGAKWDLLGFYIVIFLLLILGALALGLGLLIAIPLTWIAQAYAYYKLTEVGVP